MSADGSIGGEYAFEIARRAAASAREARAAAGCGLVLSTTSPTRTFNTLRARLQRMRYSVIRDAQLHERESRRGGFRVDVLFITLTYKQVSDPDPRDISKFVDRCVKHCARRGEKFLYTWVGELQARGALHYHLIAWLPKGMRLPMPDQSGWWPHGWSKIEKARAPVGYLAHYAGKCKGKGLSEVYGIPRGFRLHGSGGFDFDTRQWRAWSNLPTWLRERVTPEERCKRVFGGGWVSRLTRDFWPSPFKMLSVVRAGRGAWVTFGSALPEGAILCSPLASLS